MNTKIKFAYKDVPYTLEYNRASIKQLESAGFVLENFMQTPMSSIELAFRGAFLANHRNTASNEKLITEIYDNMGDKEKLVDKLIEMIGETYETLLSNNEDKEGNIKWDIADLN